MTDGSQILGVLEWIIVKGIFWEYYVIEEWNEDNCAYCLVDGQFQEIGLVCLDEIMPHISARTDDLKKISPAPGWKWIN